MYGSVLTDDAWICCNQFHSFILSLPHEPTCRYTAPKLLALLQVVIYFEAAVSDLFVVFTFQVVKGTHQRSITVETIMEKNVYYEVTCVTGIRTAQEVRMKQQKNAVCNPIILRG